MFYLRTRGFAAHEPGRVRDVVARAVADIVRIAVRVATIQTRLEDLLSPVFLISNLSHSFSARREGRGGGGGLLVDGKAVREAGEALRDPVDVTRNALLEIERRAASDRGCEFAFGGF